MGIEQKRQLELAFQSQLEKKRQHAAFGRQNVLEEKQKSQTEEGFVCLCN